MDSATTFKNKLTSLPVQFGRLKNITLLDVSYNLLESIPEDIASFYNLKIFDASYNRIKHFPVEITRMKSLQKLYLEENPVDNLAEKIINKGVYAIKDYFDSKLKF